MMSTYVWFGKSLVVTWLLTLVMTTAVSWESSVDVLAVPAVFAVVGRLLDFHEPVDVGGEHIQSYRFSIGRLSTVTQ
jgi:hypothetical protein